MDAMAGNGKRTKKKRCVIKVEKDGGAWLLCSRFGSLEGTKKEKERGGKLWSRVQHACLSESRLGKRQKKRLRLGLA